VIGAIVISLGLAWQAVSPEAVQHVRAGMEAQKQGHMDQAIAEFRKVTELAPNLPAAYVNLGAAYLQNRDYAHAIEPLKRALQMSPEMAGAQQMLGYALLFQGYAAEAIPHLEHADVPDALGIAQLETGKLPEAIANFEVALTRHPNDPDILYYLSKASGLLAKNAADTLESSFPQSARAHESLAENYAALRRVPDAEREFQQALAKGPGVPGIHLSLGELYATAAQWDKAEEEFRAEAKLQPGNAEAAYRLGTALLELGRIDEARQELKRADQLRPRMPETLYSLGKAASLAGDLDAAEKSWREQLSVERNGRLAAQAHFGLASIYRKRGQTVEAAAEMQEFQKLQH
jgi:tetratricopeptide (TPR) repeat protein